MTSEKGLKENLNSTEKKYSLQKYSTILIAIFLFATITYLYFSPLISGNSVMNQGDIVHFKGMSKELIDYRDRTGEMSLWTNSMFGGMPAYTVYLLYNGNLIGNLQSVLTLGLPHPSGLLFLSMLSFFILLVVLKMNHWLALTGAIASGLCSYNLIILEAGHNSKLAAIAYMPLVLAGAILAFKHKYILGCILTAIGLSLEVRAGHVQITYYLMIFMLVFGIVELISAWRKKLFQPFLKATAAMVVALAFGVITNAGYLMSIQEYSPSSIRGPSELSSNTESSGGLDEKYAFDWSYGKMETFTLLIPNFYGGSSHGKLSENSNTGEFLKAQGLKGDQLKDYLNGMPMYRGDVLFTSGPVYMGAIVCFLFVLGIFILKGEIKWWIIAGTIVSILLAWGRNLYFFNHFMFEYFPMYNKFRTVAMNLIILQITFPLMAMLALGKIIAKDYDIEKIKKQLLYSLYITGGICLLFALIGPSLFDFVKQTRDSDPGDTRYPDAMRIALIADRKSLLQMDALRSLFFIGAAFILIWFYLKNKINNKIVIAAILLLVFIDLFSVGKRYLDSTDFLSEKDYMKRFEMTQADQMILKDKSLDFRVLNYTVDPFQDATTSYHHKSIGGYNAAKLRRYQEVIQTQFSRIDENGKQLGPNEEVINMLNTKYVIIPAKNKQPIAQSNPNINGNAWFVDAIVWVKNADEEMAAISNFDSKGTAIIDTRFEKDLNGLNIEMDSSASIQLKTYEPNYLVYESKTNAPSFAVFSEIYYQPGWKSFIDGKEVPHVRVNYILRGMAVDAGNHTIEFKFHPETYYKGESISKMSSIALLIFSFVGIGWVIWSKRKISTEK